MNCLRGSFAPYWQSIQRALFPQLEPVLGPLTGKQQQLVQTLEVIRIEQWIPRCFRVPGRPRKDRAALACQGRTKTRPEWRRKIRPSGRPVACLKVAVRVG